MAPIKIAIIGAGNRGNLYSEYALLFPDKLKVIAVAEPNKERRSLFAEKHQLKSDFIFENDKQLFLQPKLCDAVIITTQDDNHYKPVLAALDTGYHVLVEKPMSPSLAECREMVNKAKEKKRLLKLAYVLRYTPFFQKIKELININAIGTVRHIAIDMNVAFWHQAHSFVRGNWRKSGDSSPMILAKSCHDFDIIHHLINNPCKNISSFGHLTHFTNENAPEGSKTRCLDGCLAEEKCPYSAKKIYLQENTNWPVNTICSDLSYEGRLEAIKNGPYGRCVYRCDNDVVDHQIVQLQFENHATATITMSGFTQKLERHVKILGTHGEINGELADNKIELKQFGMEPKQIQIQPATFGMHAGGDFGLLEDFHLLLSSSNPGDNDCSDILYSHLYAHIAEVSRLSDQTVSVNGFQQGLNNRRDLKAI